MKQIAAKILENKKIAQDFRKMRIKSRYLARSIKPGQFILIRCSNTSNPLLRRPFSVHRILKNGIEILYKVVGRGTTLLSQKKINEYLDVVGPLGNGFGIRNTPACRTGREYACLPDRQGIRNTILIAGGIGVAPLVALAEYLVSRLPVSAKGGSAHGRSRLTSLEVFIGAKTKKRILCEDDFKKLSLKVKITTEDGSKGKKGLISELLKDFLRNTQIYACGPNAMLKEVARIAKARRIPCQVSLEERMACGVGVCLGCPVKVKTHNAQRKTHNAIRNTQYEYKMVCKDGPVFDAEEIVW